jgi:hypothetical protein
VARRKFENAILPTAPVTGDGGVVPEVRHGERFGFASANVGQCSMVRRERVRNGFSCAKRFSMYVAT